jgi:hypothetical protein
VTGGRWFLLLLALAIVAPSALAQPSSKREPSASELLVARQLFDEATQLEKQRKFAEAEEKLRAAVAIKDTPGVRYHLAFCLDRQGKLADARREYWAAHYSFQSGATAPGIEELLGPAIEKIEARTPHVLLEYPKELYVRVDVDGQDVTVLAPLDPIWLNPGRHTIVVRSATRGRGGPPFTKTVQLSEGERVTLRVPWSEETAAASMTPRSTRADSSPIAPARDRPLGFKSDAHMAVVVGGVALALAGVGIGIWQATEAESTEYDRDKLAYELQQETTLPTSACVSPPQERQARCAELNDLNDDLDRERMLTVVSFAAAGVFAGGALAAYFLWPSEGATNAADSSRRAHAWIAAAPSPGGMQWTMSGRF